MTAAYRRSAVVGPTRRLVVAASSVCVATFLLAGCSTSGSTRGPGAASAPPTVSVPLTSSSATRTTTWATLAMGHLDDPLNTFWQLLRLTGSRWHLATPPGVASNGGLVAAVTSSSVLTGFGPSQDLRFSPVARTSGDGSSWQTGVLPAGLPRLPSALAEGYGKSLALLSTDGGQVVMSTADLSTWTTVTTASALRRQSRLADCRLRSLTAVTLDAHGDPLVGASCAKGGRAGIFTASSRGWEAVGPEIPGDPGAPTQVVRLDTTAAGTAALVSSGSGTATRLYAIWSVTGVGSWTVSAGLALGRASLVSTGVTGGGGFVVSTRRATDVPSTSVIGPHGSQWDALPELPSGTTSVTSDPDGSYDALVPAQSVLFVYGLGKTGWSRVQTLRVDIPYGSSN